MQNRDFNQITSENWDVVVIGGGIIGTGIARDAAMRGMRTLLVEKEDYSYGTTSTSSRLIHGGLRYLSKLQFGLVRLDMREREVLLRIAPHLVHPLPFLMPINSLKERFIMFFGMHLYDLISFDKTLPTYHWFHREETIRMEPNLKTENLRGAYLFYDCQIPYAERLCVENILSAEANDAIALNHAKVTGLIKKGNTVEGIRLEDTLTGKEHHINAKLVINAAGPWMDIVHSMLETGSKPMMRRTKGIHLVTKQISNNALVLFSTSDGRLFFVIPWEGYSLIGTTDTDYSEDSDTVAADRNDVEYLVREVRRSFPELKEEDIHYTFAGLRALAGSADGSASNVSRGHRLVDYEKTEGVKGFISVIGGKITGFRAIAEEITDLAAKKLGLTAKSSTANVPLPGHPSMTPEEIGHVEKLSGLSPETVAHLHNLYGSRLTEVTALIAKDDRGRAPLCPHSRDIVAQVWHAVEKEHAQTPADFLLRRSFCGMAECLGLDAIETVTEEMGNMLGWNKTVRKKYIKEYREYCRLYLQYKDL